MQRCFARAALGVQRSRSFRGLCQVAPQELFDPTWFRNCLSTLMSRIMNDNACIDKVKAEYIDPLHWKNYLNTYRRSMIKSPVETFNGEENLRSFVKQLQEAEEANKNFHDAMVPCEDEKSKAVVDYIFSTVLKSATNDLSDVIHTNKILSANCDFSVPHEWYPRTRLMKRKIYYHGGPTNSGKTYQALQRLKAADPKNGGGIYCGPLRLLALEIYDTLNRAGIVTDLITGQERKFMPGATHVSSTVEIVSIERDYDVAVIDEIQMIGDPDRGSAWTRALLGLRAREIHLCGGLEAADLVRSLCESTNDDFELVEYSRMSTLEIEPASLRGDYSKIMPGDCIVAFNVLDIFAIREQIEKHSKLRCAVIYGRLPSETRSSQARLFNAENSGYDVLVASDAIGMGLNLNIRRIIFHTVLKRDGKGVSFVPPTHIKQIAGRAGRRSSKYSVGKITTWQEADLAYVRAVMAWDIPQITAAGIFPTIEQVKRFIKKLSEQQEKLELVKDKDGAGVQEAVVDGALIPASSSSSTSTAVAIAEKQVAPRQAPRAKGAPTSGPVEEEEVEVEQYMNFNVSREETIQLSSIIQRFIGLSTVDSRYFMCNSEAFCSISNWLHTIPMTIEDRFTFAAAPVDFNSQITMRNLYTYAALYACGRPVPFDVSIDRYLPKYVDSFRRLCDKHNCLELYLWLSVHFSSQFIERETCQQVKMFAVRQINTALPKGSIQSHASLETKYVSLRDRLGEDKLPPARYGAQVRHATMQHLLDIEQEHMFVAHPDSQVTLPVERVRRERK